MPKQLLNIEFSGSKTHIDVTEAERLGQVLRAINALFPRTFAQIDAPQLQLFNQQGQPIAYISFH